MKALIFGLALLLVGSAAYAKKSCTNEPREKWMTEDAFRKHVESQGYKIEKFKQPGTCYEIYGTNREGKKVEMYFNPVDASIVKEKMEK